MKVYMLSTKNTASILPSEIKDYRKIDFKGKSLKKNWNVVKMKKVDEKEMKDVLDLSFQAPVISKKAATFLKQNIDDEAEFLEVEVENDKYFALNVTNVIPCLDEEKSIFDILPGGIKFFFEEYAFVKEYIKKEKIFKIQEERRSKIFVTDTFKEKIEKSNIEGFHFVKVWEE